jgi:two-component system, cell cycle response regulator CtrA
MRVLVAEGDLASAKRIKVAIEPAGFLVETAESGEDGLDLLKIYDFDMALIGPLLPDMEGAELLRRMRSAELTTPVLMLVEGDDRALRVRLLIAGADDVLARTFHKDELTARLQAIIRRSRGHARSVIRTGRLALDLAARTVEIDGKPLNVTPKEYGILELLSLRRGRTLTKEMFLDHLYGGMDEPEQKIVDVFICKLRKKIAKLTGETDIPIQTVWGQGYTLREPMAGLAEAGEGFVFDGDEYGPPRQQGDLGELEMLLLQLLPTG